MGFHVCGLHLERSGFISQCSSCIKFSSVCNAICFGFHPRLVFRDTKKIIPTTIINNDELKQVLNLVLISLVRALDDLGDVSVTIIIEKS